MKIIKLFDWIDIERETGINIVDYFHEHGQNLCNDIAVAWFVEDGIINTEHHRIDQYLIHNGCVIGEKVLIEISW